MSNLIPKQSILCYKLSFCIQYSLTLVREIIKTGLEPVISTNNRCVLTFKLLIKLVLGDQPHILTLVDES